MNTAKWVEKGDEYYLQVTTASPTDYDYTGKPWMLHTEVMCLSPCIGLDGTRIGWTVYEYDGTPTMFGSKWKQIPQEEPFARLDDAKTVAMAWWRMR